MFYLKSNKGGITLYFIGIVILLSLMAIALYEKGSTPDTNPVSLFIKNKQEIHDVLGQIVSVDKMPDLKNFKEEASFELVLKGKNSAGVLAFTLSPNKESFFMSNILLVTQDKTYKLTPWFVSDITYHETSASSPKQQNKTVEAGKDLFIKTKLSGFEFSKQDKLKITQTLGIFDEANNILASKKNVAHYSASSPENPALDFTTKISNLLPGNYLIEMLFHDEISGLSENHWEKISVTPPKSSVRITAVDYFANSEKTKTVSSDSFEAEKDIYVRLHLDGFMVYDSQLAGDVALKIENSLGEIVAFNPKLTSFHQAFDPQKKIYVDGHFKLKNPDVYFLSFRVRDLYSDNTVTHKEKVFITAPTYDAEEF